MSDPKAVPFILNLTVDHPPYFTMASQFVEDDRESTVKYFVTCHPDFIKTIRHDATLWAEQFHGLVELVDGKGDRPIISVTVPIVRTARPPDTQKIQPGAFFLAHGQSLAWTLARMLQSDREVHAVQKKFGGDLPLK